MPQSVSKHELFNGRHRSVTILLVALLVIFIERPALAYSDPGSGTLLWQLLVSGFVGVLFYVRKFTGFWRKKDHD